LAEQETDIIRGAGAVLALPPMAKGENISRSETWEEGRSRFTRTTLSVSDRTLTELTRRDVDTDTIWKLEHFIKSTDDLKAYLQIPDEAMKFELDCSNIPSLEEQLGEAGIVMIDMGDPLCGAADLFSMEDYCVVAMTESELFHQLLNKFARQIYPNVERISEQLPGRLWRFYGSEYASEPYLPPRLYEEYFVRYTGPMVKMVKKRGGYARIHSHGRLRNILPHLKAVGIDALDPIEPPPHGDVELREVRQQYGRDMVLFGNIEVTDIENLSPQQFEKMVVRALREGTAGDGRGFVLLPSASPYGRTITAQTMANYETMVRLTMNWGG